MSMVISDSNIYNKVGKQSKNHLKGTKIVFMSGEIIEKV
jgi:hypothetical protein